MSDYPQAIVPADHLEPVPRRVRGVPGGRFVFDTMRALYLWEWPYYPQFQTPLVDVAAEALIDEGRTHRVSRGMAARVGLRGGGVERLGAGRHRAADAVLPAASEWSRARRAECGRRAR